LGATVTLFDEAGWEYEGKIRSVDSDQAEVLIADKKPPKNKPRFGMELAQALPKGAKMDLIVEKATELGVQKILPFVSQSTVIRSKTDHDQRKVLRWERIALSAAK
jgi:16S rRNA (uracil1498-N3)-methyltransferase